MTAAQDSWASRSDAVRTVELNEAVIDAAALRSAERPVRLNIDRDVALVRLGLTVMAFALGLVVLACVLS